MKVNFNSKVNMVVLSEIKVGETFLTDRKSAAGAGLYMKVDSRCGILRYEPGIVFAVNLESGQPRKFASNFMVVPINAEIKVEDSVVRG